MKARWSVAALAVSFLLVVAPCAAQPSPERLALARQLANIFAPASEHTDRADLAAATMEHLARVTSAFSGGWQALDQRQLRVSFGVGATASVVASRASLVQSLADGMTDDEIQDALDFYQSRPGRAALRARAAYSARLQAWMRREVNERRPSTPVPEYTPSAAERDFADSRSGQALAAATRSGTLQQAIALAEADYCEQVACSADQHEFFGNLAAFVNPAPVRGEEVSAAEHSVGGKTAQEVFVHNEALRTLAVAACAGRAAEVTRSIQEEGVDPNGEGLDGVTPLIWAQSCDSLPGMEALLQGGADPNKRFYYYNAVWLAADRHRVEQLELLLRFGADVNFVAEYGDTVLIAALKRGDRGEGWENFEFLLRSGASIEQVTTMGRTVDAQGRRADHLVTVAEIAAYRLEFDRVVQLLELGYNVRLRHLARTIEVQIEDEAPTPPEQARWRARAREILVERGVQFPVGPVE